MKKKKGIIKKLIYILFFLLIIMGVVDYLRVSTNKHPVFTKIEYNSKTKKQTFKGILHQVEREISISQDEPINLSKEVKFKVYIINIPITIEKIKEEKPVIKTEEIKECSNETELYYYNPQSKQKIYTYCLKSIKLNNKEIKDYAKDDEAKINDIFDTLVYVAGNSNNQSQIYEDNAFKEITTNGITAIKCKNNDIYFAKANIEIPEDFCTDKKDTFKYDFEILDESNETTCPNQTPTCEKQPETCLQLEEVFYEDETTKYILNCKKSHVIYLVTKDKNDEIEEKILLKDALLEEKVTIEDLELKGLEFTREDK